MLKKLLLAALWLPLMALAQSYPSPTFQNFTVNGTATIPHAAITGGTITGLSSPIPQASGGTGATSITAPGGAFDTLCSSTIGKMWVRLTGAWGCSALGYANPVWWGADPTGASNSTSAFNSAISAAQAAGSQTGTVSIPLGKFLVSGITVSTANINFVGTGAPGVNAGSVILAANTSSDVFTITAPYVNFRDVSFYSPSPMTAGSFINYQSGSSLSYLDNIYMVNGYTPLAINAAGAIHAHVLEIRDFNGYGISINGNGDQYLDGVIIDMDSGSYTPQGGIQVSNSNGSVTISNSDILHAHHNLLLNPSTGQAVKWLFVTNSYFDSCDWTYSTSTGNGINVAPTGTGQVLGLMISNSWFATCNNGIALNGLSTTNIDGIHLSNVMMVNNVRNGLYSTYANHINLSNVAVAGNSNVTTGTYAGVEFNTGTDNVTITGGVIGVTAGFGSQQKYNVLFDAGFTGTANISNVNLLGGTSGGVSNANARNNTINIANSNGYNFQGPAGISLGSSPYTYNSNFMGPLVVNMYGGTVSAVTINGVQVCNSTPCSFILPSQGSFITSYSSAPSVAIFLP
ncbi:MAG TPA: hypothetical protein VJP80_08890 [Candidatus Saccharimonadales bacterium]|nr:hypothetical protein [Candidatus Saccharimonadales bacterium]